jgi:hypothetical protein
MPTPCRTDGCDDVQPRHQRTSRHLPAEAAKEATHTMHPPIQHPRRLALRRPGPLAGAVLAATSAAALAMTAPGVAFAAGAPGLPITATGPVCGTVAAGQSSGWCALYPGRAVDNVQQLGAVSVGPDGTVLTVQAEGASTGTPPATASVCLTPVDPGRSRLQHAQCVAAGGVWIPFTGGSVTIDLAQYPGLEGTTFTVQVGANGDAVDANGDAWYGNFGVTSSLGGGYSFD